MVSLLSLNRLVLPYERHRRGEEDKPLPPSKPRKQYKRSEEGKGKREGEGKKRRRTDGDDHEVKFKKTLQSSIRFSSSFRDYILIKEEKIKR